MTKRGLIRIVGLVNNHTASSLSFMNHIIHIRKYCEILKGSGDYEWHKDIGYPFICLDPYAERNFIYKENKYPDKAFIDYD